MPKHADPLSLLPAAVLLALAPALAGCGRSESAIGTPQEPLVLLLSPEHAPSGPEEPLRVLERELLARTGLSVVARVAASPADAIEQFGSRRADAGLLTLEQYLLAREEYSTRAALQVLRRKGETRFDGVMLVRGDSKARDVRDLEGQVFGFTDPYSVSGFLLPAQHLQQAAVKVQARFTGGHAAALQALLKGEVAAIATYAGQAEARRDVRVLAKTGTVPNEPLVLRRGLPAAKGEAVAAALRELAGTEVGRKTLPALADITGFGPVDEEAYRSVHGLLQAAGKTVYDLVPGGAEIRRLNQPYLDLR